MLVYDPMMKRPKRARLTGTKHKAGGEDSKADPSEGGKGNGSNKHDKKDSQLLSSRKRSCID